MYSPRVQFWQGIALGETIFKKDFTIVIVDPAHDNVRPLHATVG